MVFAVAYPHHLIPAAPEAPHPAFQPEVPLAAWSARYESLRQVTADDLTGQLAPLTGANPAAGPLGYALAVRTLKARRVLFTNPAAPLTGRRVQPPPVLPLDDGVRGGLLGRLDDPAGRRIVLLAGCTRCAPAKSAP